MKSFVSPAHSQELAKVRAKRHAAIVARRRARNDLKAEQGKEGKAGEAEEDEADADLPNLDFFSKLRVVLTVSWREKKESKIEEALHSWLVREPS